MRHALSIAFALLLLVEAFLPGMDKCELIKLANLFNHYQEVKEDTSMLVFLSSHYGDTQKNQNHHEDSHDENLPFQERPCCHGLVFFSEQTRFLCLVPEPSAEKQASFYMAPVASEYHKPVFQPPKRLS